MCRHQRWLFTSTTNSGSICSDHGVCWDDPRGNRHASHATRGDTHGARLCCRSPPHERVGELCSLLYETDSAPHDRARVGYSSQNRYGRGPVWLRWSKPAQPLPSGVLLSSLGGRRVSDGTDRRCDLNATRPPRSFPVYRAPPLARICSLRSSDATSTQRVAFHPSSRDQSMRDAASNECGMNGGFSEGSAPKGNASLFNPFPKV